MTRRTPSEQVWAELEAELSRLDRDQLARVCAHLIRTYVIEKRPATGAARIGSRAPGTAPAPAATPGVTTPRPATPTQSTTPREESPRAPAEEEGKSGEDSSRFNKLEMD